MKKHLQQLREVMDLRCAANCEWRSEDRYERVLCYTSKARLLAASHAGTKNFVQNLQSERLCEMLVETTFKKYDPVTELMLIVLHSVHTV